MNSPSYDKKYFFEDYSKQYGKSYIEDRNTIRDFSFQRLDQISRILKKPLKGLKVLDIGCAYGFFLEAAREKGAIVSGIELVSHAVQYARKKLGLSVEKADLHDYQPLENTYDIISLWYVLEHFEKPDKILSRLALALKPGGVLALSIPNSQGYSALCNLPLFLKERPTDHFFDFSPKAVAFLGRLFGLKLVKIVVKGIHFHRFKARCKMFFWIPDIKIFHQLFSSICRILKIGDTMEVYLQKG